MGIRAILQKGRTKPGLVLPADAQAKVNEVNDRSTLEKWASGKAPGANIQKQEAGTAPLANTTAPLPVADKETENGETAAQKDTDALQTGTLTSEGHVAQVADDEGTDAPDAGADESTDAANEVTDEVTDAVRDDMTRMDSIGEADEQKLYEAGYLAYEHIAEASAADLVEKISDMNASSAKALIKQAKKLAKLKAKGKL